MNIYTLITNLKEKWWKKVDLTSIRGEIITKFTTIELFLESIISLHYFGEIKQQFIFEVLKDDYFSFGLKRNIFEKVFNKERRYPEFLDDLNRLNKIRNLFAHRHTLLKGPSIQEADVKLFDPKDMSGLDIQKLYKEFLEKFHKISSELFKISKEFGAKFTKYRPKSTTKPNA